MKNNYKVYAAEQWRCETTALADEYREYAVAIIENNVTGFRFAVVSFFVGQWDNIFLRPARPVTDILREWFSRTTPPETWTDGDKDPDYVAGLFHETIGQLSGGGMIARVVSGLREGDISLTPEQAAEWVRWVDGLDCPVPAWA